MKSNILVALTIALTLISCSNKKSRKGGAATPPAGDANFHNPNPSEDGDWDNAAQHDCMNPGQNQGCPQQNDQVLTIVQTRSWRYTNDASTTPISSDDTCAQSVTASAAGMDYTLNGMDLRLESNREGAAARCLIQTQVSYPSGYAFAIRRVRVGVSANVRSDARADMDGSYQIMGKENVNVARSFAGGSNQTVTVTTQVNDQTLDWSPCDGRATVASNTNLTMRLANGRDLPGGTNPLSLGSISVDSSEPYRIEIVWSKCR